ncbi:hypothetical protein A9Q91_02445 [Candidatus Gracilibacteria bacterium 28_42_T64]|nr:hypothetical protein A9Q91_02445 [Candidatus Gracilibacteria bacterium 28_42_T64]
MIIKNKEIFFIITLFIFAIIIMTFSFHGGKKDDGKLVQEISVNTLNNSQALMFDNFLSTRGKVSGYTNNWGRENIINFSNGELKIFYPKGSYTPSKKPVGGLGFIKKLSNSYEHAKLTYKVKFDTDFDFVKGGKLPGFCGGDCSRGGLDTDNGFSTRFMWRTNGYLEVYAYLATKKGTYGKSLGRGMITMVPDKYYEISQEIVLNTPGKANGVLIVSVDGEEVYRNTELIFRKNSSLGIDSLLFSTFFGGGDPSWSSEKDNYSFMKDFEIFYE